MSEFVKTIVRNALFVVTVFCAAIGVFLLSGDPIVAAVAGTATAVFVKFDDYRIRKARRKHAVV